MKVVNSEDNASERDMVFVGGGLTYYCLNNITAPLRDERHRSPLRPFKHIARKDEYYFYKQ